MKFSKNFNLVLGILFTIDFIYSLFDERDTHDLFSFEVNIWIYRIYRLAIASIFIKIYLKQREDNSK